MRRAWKQIRSAWNKTDSVLIGTNTASFALFIGNCWWHSATVCVWASLVPLALQAAWAFRHSRELRAALAFGAIIAAAWPIGEGLVTIAVGWWGEYLAPGLTIWRTPVYCMLIGWLASTHIYYVCKRTLEIGFSPRVCVINTVFTATMLGVIGENLFVAANMWVYFPSDLDWLSVPAFVPVAYGIGYGVLPFIKNWDVRRASAAVAGTLLVVSVGLGFAVGFFPR